MKQLASWKVAGIYYLIYLGASIVLSGVFSFLWITALVNFFSPALQNVVRIIIMLFLFVLALNIATASVTKWLRKDTIHTILTFVLIFVTLENTASIVLFFLTDTAARQQGIERNLISVLIKGALDTLLLYFVSRVFLQSALQKKRVTKSV